MLGWKEACSAPAVQVDLNQTRREQSADAETTNSW